MTFRTDLSFLFYFFHMNEKNIFSIIKLCKLFKTFYCDNIIVLHGKVRMLSFFVIVFHYQLKFLIYTFDTDFRSIEPFLIGGRIRDIIRRNEAYTSDTSSSQVRLNRPMQVINKKNNIIINTSLRIVT